MNLGQHRKLRTEGEGLVQALIASPGIPSPFPRMQNQGKGVIASVLLHEISGWTSAASSAPVTDILQVCSKVVPFLWVQNPQLGF